MATAGSALTAAPAHADPAHSDPYSDPVAGPILKPLPAELFTVYGSNAEMRWEAMAGQGYVVPVDRFFVRDHTLFAQRFDNSALVVVGTPTAVAENIGDNTNATAFFSVD